MTIHIYDQIKFLYKDTSLSDNVMGGIFKLTFSFKIWNIKSTVWCAHPACAHTCYTQLKGTPYF